MAVQPKDPAPSPVKPAVGMGQRVIVWVVAFAIAFAVWYVVDRYLLS